MSSIASLLIPGQWPTRSCLLGAVAEQSGGYLFAGSLLHHTARGPGLSVHCSEHVPDFVDDALRCSPTGMRDEDWEALKAHRHLIEVWAQQDVMDLDQLWNLVLAAEGLVNAGGNLVMILSTLRAYSAQAWRDLIVESTSSSSRWHILYNALTSIRADAEWYFSVGMKLFGRADIAIPRTVDRMLAIERITRINLLQLAPGRSLEYPDDLDKWGEPNLKSFKAVWDEEERYAEEHPSHNPKGIRRIQF
jgi:hypothetical protein